jgi:DNA-binding transcriptional ArsR family regulator
VKAPRSSIPELDVERAASMYKAFGHPIRLRILLQLSEQPACVHDLTRHIAASQPLISQHLRILRQERLVDTHRSGKEMIYRLTDSHIAHILRDGMVHIHEEEASWVPTPPLKFTRINTDMIVAISPWSTMTTLTTCMMDMHTSHTKITMTNARDVPVRTAMMTAPHVCALIAHAQPAITKLLRN